MADFAAKTHDHQTLEGTTHVNGCTVSRTSFSENYPRKFARLIAKQLIKINPNKTRSRVYGDAFVVANRAFKRAQTGDTKTSVKRAKLNHQPLIEPQMMPAKRRRLDSKERIEIQPRASNL